jgi:hypothetical protein
MERKQSVLSPVKRSPEEEHRRQMLTQVWLPLAASLLVLLAVMILTVIGAIKGSSLVDKWGALSAIYIIIPVLFGLLVVSGLVGGCVYGMARLLPRIPGWFLTIRLFVIRISMMIRRGLDATTKPILSVGGFMASTETLWKHYFH